MTAHSDMEHALRAATAGEVMFDAFSRGRHATDASIYQMMPMGVVVSRSVADVEATLAVAREAGVPVLPREGGSSQCGQTVNEAIVIDVFKHLNKLISLDIEARTVVVETLKVLATEGLVELTPNRGASVARLILSDLGETFPIMGALEAVSGEIACRHITDAGIARVRELHARMVAKYKASDLNSCFKLNEQIHDAIMDAARNPTLAQMQRGLSGRIRRARYMANMSPTRRVPRGRGTRGDRGSPGGAQGQTAGEDPEGPSDEQAGDGAEGIVWIVHSTRP